MDRGGGGGVVYANRNGRSDYDDRHVDNGGYNAYNSNSNGANDLGGGYRRIPGPGHNGPSNTANGARASGGGSMAWGQFNDSSSSGSRPRNDNSQYTDRPSNLASRGSQLGSPPNSQSYDGPGRGGGEHRNTFNDSASSYRGHGNDGPSNPSESLRAYQQSKSSDPSAVGLRSTAAFFHETYDKLERPGGFADSTSGKQYTVTFIKTYREMATQTTEDQVVGCQDSTWNGVRIIGSGKQQPQPQYPQQQQHQQQQQQQQHQLQQQRAAQAYSKTAPAPTVATPARSTATVTSLLNAVLTPSQSPVVSSAIATKPTSGSQGPSNQYTSDERRPYGVAANGGTAGTQPLSVTASSANKPDNSSWMASPETDNRKNTAATTPHDTKKADPWGATPTAANSSKADSWSQPAVSSAKEDSWAQPAVSGSNSTAANSRYSSWGNTSQGKAVSDLVDWSTGLVSEFPTEAKPTFMAVTEPWDRMGKYDPAYVAGRQDTNSRQKTQQQQPQQQQQHQQQRPQRQQQLPPPQQLQQHLPRRQQQQHSNSEDDDEDRHLRRGRGLTQDKREVREEQVGPDPWLNDGNAGLSDWASSEPAESQMIFMDHDEVSSQGQLSHASEPQVQQQHHRGASRHRDDDDGHYPGTGASQDRRPLTSEERFNNSFNRPPGGSSSSSSGGMSGGAASGRYGSKSGPGSRYGSGESGGGGGGGHGYERAQRHGPTTVTPSSTVGLTGRRYFNNTMDRDSALGAWSTASQNASKPSVAPSGSSSLLTGSGSTSHLATNATAGSQGSSSVKSPTSGGRLALATASDFGSFFQAAATFTPPPAKVRQGGRVRRGSESGSTTTRHSSPNRSRESSRSRPSHSGAVLEHTEAALERTEEESIVGAEENLGHCSLAPGHEQAAEVEREEEDLIKDDEDLIKNNEDLIKDEDVVPAAVGTEEDKGEGQEVVVESERKATPRMNSNSSRTSSQAMEDNLLNFQLLKQPVASGSGVKEDEEEGEDGKKEVVGGGDGASGGSGGGSGEVDKVAVGSSQGSPKADSDHDYTRPSTHIRMAITQGNNNGAQAAAAANEAAVFEAERSRLITNIQIEMTQVLSNVTILNRNLETIITIGQEFGQLSQLWKHFHASAFQLAEEERFEREAAAWTTTVHDTADEGQRGEGEEEGGEYMDERYVGGGGGGGREQQDDDEEHYQEDEREQDEEQEL
ncbi:hypothetical protein BGZ95_000189 [Linnemannia exigua]|uniref:DASH complex subunit DAD1 n=1 Tax=Linnemannia exigua TaxID=604196 RepID=A0AAD4H5S8_9FUNG|nr:hypothetical protein BGZ95_000189 [Linnemannia exigua]